MTNWVGWTLHIRFQISIRLPEQPKETCNWCWKWWSLADSNRWPSACKADALPTELKPLKQFLQSKKCGKRNAAGNCEANAESIYLLAIEPARIWLRQLLSQVHYFCGEKLMLVGRRRLELPTSPLSGARSNQLSYRPPYQHAYNLIAASWSLKQSTARRS